MAVSPKSETGESVFLQWIDEELRKSSRTEAERLNMIKMLFSEMIEEKMIELQEADTLSNFGPELKLIEARIANMAILREYVIEHKRLLQSEFPRAVAPSGFVLRAILPPEDAEDRIANLEHWFHTVWCEKHSRNVARVLFHCQVVRSIIAFYADKWKSWVELLLPKKG